MEKSKNFVETKSFLTLITRSVVKVVLAQDGRDDFVFEFTLNSYNKERRRAIYHPTKSTDYFLAYASRVDKPQIISVTFHPGTAKRRFKKSKNASATPSKDCINLLHYAIQFDAIEEKYQSTIRPSDSWSLSMGVTKNNLLDFSDYFRWVRAIQFELLVDEKLLLKVDELKSERRCNRKKGKNWISKVVCGAN
ncbi:5320_t:CDS:2 [Ambispora gerdemannii]|uniref:5320_t:CDS:1 n=1 Tax=Ambispora gerdemannii TaxID=144530 RepID=A0A9N9H137_9GLOM|nr:5320_t:CDS:2 [Ambispora gerdemannii]